MNTEKLISFLGHGSIHPPLDDFLLENGIKKRPKQPGLVWITDKATGLVLNFEPAEIFDEKSLIPKKSQGKHILSEVTFPPNFPFPLPYGLSLALSKEEIERKLGSAVKENPAIPYSAYFYSNYLIGFNWSQEEPFIRFHVPTIYHKKNMGIDVR